MRTNKYLSETISQIQSDIFNISMKIRHIFGDTYRFDQEDFNKLMLIMPELHALISKREELEAEYFPRVEKIEKKREAAYKKQEILKKQKEDAEWEALIQLKKEPIVLTKEMFSDFIKKTISSRNLFQKNSL